MIYTQDHLNLKRQFHDWIRRPIQYRPSARSRRIPGDHPHFHFLSFSPPSLTRLARRIMPQQADRSAKPFQRRLLLSAPSLLSVDVLVVVVVVAVVVVVEFETRLISP